MCTDVNGQSFVVSLTTGELGPCLHFEGTWPHVRQDDARRMARAILALPRPVDAKPEEVV
jgi:hypothetical protein